MLLKGSRADSRRPSPAARLLVAFVATASLGAGIALADVTTVPPRYVVVTQDNSPLRSGDKDQYYRVGHLKSGIVLRVDGEGAGWLRVEYPAGSSAFVPVAEARPTSSGKTVVLAQPSRLHAANVARGFKSSWKTLLDEPLATGTELKLLEEIRAENGDLLGFRVETPRAARAYVHGQFVRAATADEAKTYASQGVEPANVLATPEATPNAETDTPPQAEDPRTNPAPEGGNVDNSLLEPIAEGGGTPTPPVVTDDTTTNPGDEATGNPAENPTAEELEVVDTALTIRELEAMYAQVKAQPPEEAELEECLAEHQKLLDSLEDVPYNDRLRRQLSQRIAAIGVRIGYRDELRRIQESSASGRTQVEELRQRLQQVEAAGGYTLVGRLTASAIYDGERLPLLLAVRSIEGAPRTLAYIRPSDTQADVRSLIGNVVGIVGTIRDADDLPVRLINVGRIESVSSDAGLTGTP